MTNQTNYNLKNFSGNSTPKISIGMPVYNGEKFINEAIESLLMQTFTEFELIISDNCSEDKTAEICKEYAAKDGRIKYFRQQENIGASANFSFLLNIARCEYFMWAAADDKWGKQYLDLTFDQLSNDDSLAGVTVAPYDYPCSESVEAGYFGMENDLASDRINSCIRAMVDGNARYYCLYRITYLKSIDLLRLNHLGGDWNLVINILDFGKIRVIYNSKHGFVKTTEHSISRHRYFLLHYCNSFLDIIQPLRKFEKSLPVHYRKNNKFKLLRLEFAYALRMVNSIRLFLSEKYFHDESESIDRSRT
jgi:glycosyltransferase involved in cell wall biosynthesis